MMTPVALGGYEKQETCDTKAKEADAKKCIEAKRSPSREDVLAGRGGEERCATAHTPALFLPAACSRRGRGLFLLLHPAVSTSLHTTRATATHLLLLAQYRGVSAAQGAVSTAAGKRGGRGTHCSLRFCSDAALSFGLPFCAAAFFCAFRRSISRWLPPAAPHRRHAHTRHRCGTGRGQRDTDGVTLEHDSTSQRRGGGGGHSRVIVLRSTSSLLV